MGLGAGPKIPRQARGGMTVPDDPASGTVLNAGFKRWWAGALSLGASRGRRDRATPGCQGTAHFSKYEA